MIPALILVGGIALLAVERWWHYPRRRPQPPDRYRKGQMRE